MKFFLDTANIEEIRAADLNGYVDGVTTNPSLISKINKPFNEVIKEICSAISGPVSVEVVSLDSENMFKEGYELAKIAKNVVVKVPMTDEGMVAVRRFSKEGISTNVTLVFSPLQALLAAKAGATMVSPFVGRLDDIGLDGISVIEQIRHIYDNYEYKTEILVASIRHPIHILNAALMSADIVTCPYDVIKKLSHHPLTEKGIAQFLKDWDKVSK